MQLPHLKTPAVAVEFHLVPVFIPVSISRWPPIAKRIAALPDAFDEGLAAGAVYLRRGMH
jgi:hypothetical protein